MTEATPTQTRAAPETLDAQTARELEWPRLVEALRSHLRTPMGREALHHLAPLPDVASIRSSLAAVAATMELVRMDGPLPLPAEAALGHLLERAERGGRLEVEELAHVLAVQRGCEAVRDALRLHPDAAPLVELAAACQGDTAFTDLLDAAITPDGTLNEHTYPALATLRRSITECRESIHRRLERVLRSSDWAHALQDELYTVRGSRYVVPIKVDFRGQVPGIVHDVSGSGLTLYIEPQSVVEETNTLMVLTKQLEQEEHRILQQLSDAVGHAADWLRGNQVWLARVDGLHARAQLALAYEGTVPAVEAAQTVALRGVAHPLLLLQGERVVRNDVALPPEQPGLVISGANTGGKTVLLKAVGLCALLVRHGLPIPAQDGSRMDAFPAVWADVGDPQNVEASLSTFSGRVRFLAEVLNQDVSGRLVLLDEILTGTEPQEGAALAGAVLEALVEGGASCIATTHYAELKHTAAEHPRLQNASVEFDLERLLPTYRLHTGLPGSSYALAIARRHGLPEALVQKAEQTVAGRPAAAEALLFQVQEAQRRLEAEREAFESRERALQQRVSEAENRERALQEKERELRRRERGAIGKELADARERIASVIKELQQANSLQVVNAVRERLKAVGEDLDRQTAPEHKPLSPEEVRALAAGTRVRVAALDRVGEFQELVDEGQRARVRLGSLSLEVGVDELAEAPPPPPPKPPRAAERTDAGEARPRRKGRRRKTDRQAQPREEAEVAPDEDLNGVRFTLPTRDNTLDLRGMRLHEALDHTDEFLDKCVMKHISPVVLIHGHGTGALKKGVREKLEGSAYVDAFRPGQGGEGKDGVTVVALAL